MTTTLYDYIVVGGGAAGCAFVGRLLDAVEGSNITPPKVLLLEGGPNVYGRWGARMDTFDWPSDVDLTRFDVPGEYPMMPYNSRYSEYVWPGLVGWQAKVLGGGGSMNGALNHLPHSEDFEQWPEGWSWSDMEPMFDWLYQELPITDTPSADGVFYDTLNEFIFSALDQTGFTLADLAVPTESIPNTYGYPGKLVRNGLRESSCTALVGDRLARAIAEDSEDFHVVLNADVQQLLLESGEGVGVKYVLENGSAEIARLSACGRIVLAAGAQNTPKLLMRSGIGPLSNLNSLQSAGLLNTVQECPECDDPSQEASWVEAPHLGSHFSDHSLTRMRFRRPDQDTFTPPQLPCDVQDPLLQDYFEDQTGFYAQYNAAIGVAYIRTEEALNAGPNIELFWGTGVGVAPTCPSTYPPGEFEVFSLLLQPRSVASLVVASDANGLTVGPRDYVDLYLKDELDVKAVAASINQTVAALLAADPEIQVLLPRCNNAECAPGEMPSFESITQLVLSWDNSRLQMNHWASTCRLGTCASPNDGLVVGTKKIHVVDSSLFLQQLTGHPYLTACAVGARMADLMLETADCGDNGGAGGDPHFSRWKTKRRDTFHGECDMVLLRSEKFHQGAGFDLHVRTTIDSFYSYIESAAVRVGSHVLEIFSANKVYLDGEEHDMTELDFLKLPSRNGDGYNYTFFNVETREKKRVFTLSMETSKVHFRFHKHFLTVDVHGGSTDFVDSVGLLGNRTDGSMWTRHGEPFAQGRTFTEYGFEWQVNPSMGDPQLFTDKDRSPQLPYERCRMPTEGRPQRRHLRSKDSALYEQARTACEDVATTAHNVDLCIDDIMTTGELGLAEVW